MLSVILMILKIIGIVLLGLLGLVIFLLLLLLLVPVRYRGKAAKEDNITADIHATWLLHLVHVILTYGPDGLGKKVKVFGISLKSFETVPEKKADESDSPGDGEAEEATGENTEKQAVKNEEKAPEETCNKNDSQSKAEAKNEVKAESATEGSAKTESGVITEKTDEKFPGHKAGRKKKKTGDTAQKKDTEAGTTGEGSKDDSADTDADSVSEEEKPGPILPKSSRTFIIK